MVLEYLNDKYNQNDDIVQKMFDDPVNHEQLYFKRHLEEMGVDGIKDWDGDYEKLSTNFVDTLSKKD